jgi:hypothetical protein
MSCPTSGHRLQLADIERVREREHFGGELKIFILKVIVENSASDKRVFTFHAKPVLSQQFTQRD